MRYCVYVSKGCFDIEIKKIKNMLKNQNKEKGSNSEINYKLSNEQNFCYIFINERDLKPNNYFFKAVLNI